MIELAIPLLFSTTLTLLKSDLAQGWAEDVLGGLAGKLLEGTLAGLTRERRKRLDTALVRERLKDALQKSITFTLQMSGENLTLEQREVLTEALETWVQHEDVQDCFGRLLDPRKDSPLDLETLTQRFDDCAPPTSLKGLELDFPAFLTCLAGRFQAVVQADDVLREHFALPELEALVQQAVKQSGLQEQIQQNTALSTRLQSLQLQEQKKTNRLLTKTLRQPARERAQVQDDARRAWLEIIKSECSNIPLQGLDTDAADSERAKKTPLSGIYIALNTTTWVYKKKGRRKTGDEQEPLPRMQGEGTRPLTVLEATEKTPRMVLLGAPGSGKSTFMRHLALSLAQGQLVATEEKPYWQQQLAPLTGAQFTRLPVVVVLRELAAWLAATEPDTTAASLNSVRAQALLKGYLEHACGKLKRQQCLAAVWQALEQGKALLLLDGLDEIPATGTRIGQVKALLEGLAEGWVKTPMIVTCRVLSWEGQGSSWKLDKRWNAFELDALDDVQIADFIRRWYEQLEAGGHIKQANEKIQLLQQAVKRSELRELAGNPLLLTVMALLHGHRGLPDSRLELYEQAVDLLLERWEKTNKPDLDRSRALQDWLSQAPCHLNDLKRGLSRLAFDAHIRGGEAAQKGEESRPVTSDISEGELSLELAKLHPRKELVWVERGLELIKERAGLLVESKPGEYHFPHRTFQEYLAARHLGGQKDYINQAHTLAKQGAYWWEALRLSAARLVQVEVGYQALGLIAALSPAREPSKGSSSAWRQIWLAGELLKGIRRYAENEPLGQDLLERTRRHLVRLLELGELSPRERHEAGLILGHLDDPRLGLEKPANWIWIPPGKFLMGDNEGSSDEKPAHTVKFAQGFFVSRYPVTNHDFAAFIRAGGYQAEAWWSQDGWAFCQQEGLDAPRWWTDEQWNAPNQPVVGVSWYEADAFCRWMNTERQHLPQALRNGEKPGVIRLPSEAEWEYMARGEKRHRYPWGDEEPTPDLANYEKTGLRQTSAVGAFPKGATLEGVLDVAGNVWEWCADPWHETYEGAPANGRPWTKNPSLPNWYDKREEDPMSFRVLRGGSWNYDAVNLCSAYRLGRHTRSRVQNRGFRVLAAVLPGGDTGAVDT